MFSKIAEIETRFNDLEADLSRPEVIKDQSRYQKYAKEHSALSPIVISYRTYLNILNQIEENKLLLNDSDHEISQLAKDEAKILEEKLSFQEEELKLLLLPKDPNDEKNTLLEIRAGTGGDEAALFAADLFRMYSRYAEQKRWKTEIYSESSTGIGGFKEIILLIEGQRVYSRLKFESGVHRVQRVPTTETQGRIHTSAVTVAVLPEAEDIDIKINADDLRIDVYRSSGCGGQSVNTTDSAVRVTHLPTNMVVTCQDEKSQHKNKAKAIKILMSRLYDAQQAEQQSKISEERRSMVGSGDRSERIRTYNFPQARCTDHRIGLTLYKLEDIMQGNLDQLIEPIIAFFQTEALKNSSSK